MLTADIVPNIIQQHVEEIGLLFATRTALCTAPHVKLHHLRRFDNSLAAHLDGLSIAGEHGWPFCTEALETASPGAVFAASVRAIEDKHPDRLDQLFALVEAVPDAAKGLIAAFGWPERTQLQGVVANLLGSPHAFRRMVGIAACAIHRVDPGLAASRRMEDADPLPRARALKAAAELGKREFVSTVAAAIHDSDPLCQLWAAWSAVLLGDRQNALELLKHAAYEEGPLQPRLFQLALQALEIAEAHLILRRCAQAPEQQRWLIRGAGFVGDPGYIPWLISLMSNDQTARIAGDAFSFITGVDLAALDLERDPPEEIEGGPNDDPDDFKVEMDPDENLPWPDPQRVQSWWDQNGARFKVGTRHLVGAPVSRAHCIDVLRNGYQHQRIAAAMHLCLLEPGTALFEWRAPAWRQQSLLAQMS